MRSAPVPFHRILVHDNIYQYCIVLQHDHLPGTLLRGHTPQSKGDTIGPLSLVRLDTVTINNLESSKFLS